ncbi:MAG: hypothetical protein ABI882_13390 [Acidobacteriota bacterium]
MAKKSRPTFQKREKERARTQKQKEKEVRRIELKETKANTTTIVGDEDPDIAGIRPGPQPLSEHWFHLDGPPPEDKGPQGDSI